MSKDPRRVPERLRDIRQAIENIKSDLGDVSKDEFLIDGKTQRAVVESLIVIGEAANNIMRMDPLIELTQPDLWQQFRDIYGMRIILTHEYFRIDAAIVWDTIENDLPNLETMLKTLASENDGGGDGSGGGLAGGPEPGIQGSC